MAEVEENRMEPKSLEDASNLPSEFVHLPLDMRPMTSMSNYGNSLREKVNHQNEKRAHIPKYSKF